MHSINKDLEVFRGQLEKGSIQRAYQALLSYMMQLRTHFENNVPGAAVSDLSQGYMDITFFALFPPALKQRNLKVPIVFNYRAFRFEAWLAGRNRKVQQQYWELLKDGRWPNYRISTPAPGVDSILECDLATHFDLDDPEALTASIEAAAVAFIDDIELFLAKR
jgi:hypothetical protein